MKNRDKLKYIAYKEFIKTNFGEEMLNNIDAKIDIELTNHVLHLHDWESFEKERMELR